MRFFARKQEMWTWKPEKKEENKGERREESKKEKKVIQE